VTDAINRDLHHRHAAIGSNDVAVRPQALGGKRRLDFRQIEPSASDRDARTNVRAFRDLVLEILRDEMPPWIKRNDLPRFRPLPERADRGGRKRIGEIRSADRIERSGRERERAIE
jgi:hypothetical protein